MGIRWEKTGAGERRSLISEISSYEDLQESPGLYEYEREDALWVIEVRGRMGLPRPRYGALVMTLRDDGELTWRLMW